MVVWAERREAVCPLLYAPDRVGATKGGGESCKKRGLRKAVIWWQHIISFLPLYFIECLINLKIFSSTLSSISETRKIFLALSSNP